MYVISDSGCRNHSRQSLSILIPDLRLKDIFPISKLRLPVPEQFSMLQDKKLQILCCGWHSESEHPYLMHMPQLAAATHSFKVWLSEQWELRIGGHGGLHAEAGGS